QVMGRPQVESNGQHLKVFLFFTELYDWCRTEKKEVFPSTSVPVWNVGVS
ncbi:hypothetical protein CRM22_003069, partial [Opisthorchis felineus]